MCVTHQNLRAQLSPRLSFFLSIRKSKNYNKNYVKFILNNSRLKRTQLKAGQWMLGEAHPRG